MKTAYTLRFRLAARLHTLKRSLHFLCGLLLLVIAPPSFSAEPATNVYFAGFALAGNAAESEKAFPISSRLLKEQSKEGTYLLETELWKHVQSSNHPKLTIKRDLASGLVPGDSVAMAFVLEWENISSETVAGRTKVVADLHGQVMIFDFESKKVIGSYPAAVQLLDVIDGPINDKVKESLIRGLYFGTSGNSLFAQAAKRLPSVSAKPSTGNYIQIVSIDLEGKARQTLADYRTDPQVLISRVADAFGERLFENNHVAYIPYSKGSAIGSKMAARFANGDVFQLELPTPDYRIHLNVRGYKKVLLDSNNVESAWGYASYMNVAIKSFDDSTVYLDAPFKFAVTKNVVSGTHDQDDWSAFQESTLSLINQITLQIAAPDSDWLKEWSDGSSTKDQLKKLSGILARTR
ncbi:MAG: exported protein of unknown function [Pseudomonas sp.]|nr:exported protein of unknown function [Pseudomonas sp.]